MHEGSVRRLRGALLLPAVLLLLASAPGCEDDGTDPTDTTQAFSVQGVAAGQAGTSGVISADVAATGGTSGSAGPVVSPAVAAAGGTFDLDGSATNVALTGSYETTTGLLTLAGGGYTFTGTRSAGQVTGTFTGPGGTGAFVAIDEAADLAIYCGSFAGTDSGRWLLVVSGGTVLGVLVGSDGQARTLSGTLAGNAFTLTVPGQGFSATGTLTGGTASGTWIDTGNAGATGTWSASPSGCS